MPEPQARALASSWIEACDEEQAEQQVAAASSSAVATASESVTAEEAAEMTEELAQLAADCPGCFP